MQYVQEYTEQTGIEENGMEGAVIVTLLVIVIVVGIHNILDTLKKGTLLDEDDDEELE